MIAKKYVSKHFEEYELLIFSIGLHNNIYEKSAFGIQVSN